MRKTRVVVLAWAVLSIVTPLTAQRPNPARADANSKDAVRRAAHSVTPELAARCGEVTRLQSASLEAANRVVQLSRAQRLNRPAIQAQALTSRNDLQAVLRDLAAMEPSANDLQKAVIASLLVHDREAAQQADQLVTSAQDPSAQGGTIAAHANGVIQHVQQAQIALRTDPNTGQASGQRRSELCAATATAAPAHVRTGPVTGTRPR